MAKRKPRETVCSFCINIFPHKQMYHVELPMFREAPERGSYYTPCCYKCIDKKDTKERIIGIREEPREKPPKEEKE